MSGLGELPREAWLWVVRWTAIVIALSALGSAVAAQLLMLSLSQGLDLAGLITSIAMPVLLGTPPLAFSLVRQQQWRIANTRLEQMAATDWLTGCLNRRAFTQTVEAGVLRGDAGALLIIDVDSFKAINDGYGHDRGDDVLVGIAAAIRGALRNGDSLGRMGGEEFAVYLAGADRLSASIIADRIRHAVLRMDFSALGPSVPVSVSIGGTMLRPGLGFAELFREADQRLYAAKADGRNCVRFAEAAGPARTAAA